MANRDLMLRILGDATSYERATNRAATSSKQLEKHVTGLEAPIKKTHTALLNMATGLLGAGGVVFGLESMIKAAKDAEESQGHLSVTMKDAGLSYDAHKVAIEGVIAKQSELAGFQKTDLRESYAALIRQSKDVGQANSDLALTVDIARGRHIDLAAAQNIVIKANIGMVGALKRMGIEIAPVHDAMNALTDSHKQFTTAQKDAAKALDLAATKQAAIAALQKTYGGQAEEYGKSSAGAADKFKTSLTNLEITLGKSLLPTLTDGLTHVTDWFNKLNDSGDAARYAKDGTKIFKGSIEVATPIVKEGAEMFERLSDALGSDKKAVEALAGAFAAYKLAGVIGGIGATAGEKGAAGKVGLLTSRLKTLGAIGVIAIEIDVFEKFIRDPSNRGHSFVQDLALLGPTMAVGAFDALFGGGGAKAGSGGVPGNTPQTGSSGGKKGKSQGAAIAAVARTQLGIAYQWGGPAVLGQHTDCSGLAQAVLAKNGISVGRTTYEQWTQGRAVMPGDLQAGDLVFFHMGPRGPEHVGIYIGDDQFIEDPHTGASVRISKLSTYPGFVGARRYTTADKGGQTAPVPKDSPSAADIVAGGKGKKAKKAPVLTGTKLLSKATQLALAKAGGTSGTADDLSALEDAKAELIKLPQTIAVAKELASVEKQIHSIQQTDLKAHLAKQTAQWKKHEADVKATLKAQQVAWKAHIADLQAVADEAKRISDRAFGEASGSLFTQFDRQTQAGLLGFVVTQTPEEKALADFVAKRTADALAKSRADQLTNASTDDERAALALGFTLDDQQQALQDAAEASRQAQNTKTAEDQQNYQDKRDADRQALSDWLDDQKAALDSGKESWNDFYKELKKKAALGGWDTGSAFWDSWNAAAAANKVTTHDQTIVAGAVAALPFLGVSSAVRGGLDPAIALAMARHAAVPGLADGGTVLKTGLAVVHEGERYDGGRGFGDGLTVVVEGDVIGVDNLIDKIHAGLLRKQQSTRLGFKAS